MADMTIGAVTIDCLNPDALSDFYARMLGWEKTYADVQYNFIASPGFPVRIGFQKNEDYTPPVWPEKPGAQQQMVHIDFKVNNVEAMQEMVKHAIACGARVAEEQYSESWTVMFDPEGHPFCIDTL